MIGKAQLLAVLKTATTRRIAVTAGATDPPGRLDRQLVRERALSAIMMDTRVTPEGIVALLSDAELLGAARKLGYRTVAGAPSVDLLRDLVSGRIDALLGAGAGAYAREFTRQVVGLAKHLDAFNCAMRLDLSPPAKERDVAAVERRFGVRLPELLRTLVTEVASAFIFAWDPFVYSLESPRQLDLADHLEGLLVGRLEWNIGELLHVDPSFFEDTRGQRVLPFFYDGTGDYAAIGEDGRVVWWCHDDYQEHGEVLSGSVEAFMKCWATYCWIRLGRAAVQQWTQGTKGESEARELRLLLCLPAE